VEEGIRDPILAEREKGSIFRWKERGNGACGLRKMLKTLPRGRLGEGNPTSEEKNGRRGKNQLKQAIGYREGKTGRL